MTGSVIAEAQLAIRQANHVVSVSTGVIKLGPPVSMSSATICENWPVWFDVLPVLNLKGPNYVWCGLSDVWSVCDTYLMEHCIIIERWETLRTKRLDLLLVTGTPKFVREVSSAFPDVTTWAATRARRGKRLEKLAEINLEWKWTSHVYVGGVTSGEYWVGTNAQLPNGWNIREDCNKRCLRDIFSPTEEGHPVRAPPMELRVRPTDKAKVGQRDVCFGAELLPLSAIGIVVTPSVYSPTGWVRRPLGVKELAAIFDLPVRLQGASKVEQFLPVIRRSVPAKVVNGVLGAMRDTLQHYERRYSPLISSPLPLPVRQVRFDVAGKAAKADDATANFDLWLDEFKRNLGDRVNAVEDDLLRCWLESLRKGAVRWWKKRIAKEARSYMSQRYGSEWCSGDIPREAVADKMVLCDVIRKVQASDYWGWHGGSTLFFWRWPPAYQMQARDRVKVFVRGKLPKYKRHQPKLSDAAKATLVRNKLSKVTARGYMERGPVRSLTGFFDVPKTEVDIRLVYGATKCGLNEAVWPPNFFIPSADTLSRYLTKHSWLGDIDLGEFFLNFPLDPRIRPYAGVDLTHYVGDGKRLQWFRWSRCLMGFKPSPYNSAQTFGWAEELIRGDPKEVGNPFGWTTLSLNLPGNEGYNSGEPWISRLSSDGAVSGEVIAYVDDLRIVGSSLDHCWNCLKRVSASTTFLGMQDAVRKRRPPSQTPGPWAGVVVGSEERPYVTVTVDRWAKTKRILRELYEVSIGPNEFDYKLLLSYRGFLIYISRTYPMFKPYLKGLHLTIDSWRFGRGDDGWKLECWKREEQPLAANDAPLLVTGVPRLRLDLKALLILVAAEEPAVRFVRPTKLHVVVYGFGDASGKGFGTTFTGKDKIHHRVGIWGADPENASSNFRELANLVESLEDGVAKGQLQQCEIFLFTDNSTAENAFFKGTSSNRRLFELVLRLRLLELYHDLHIHLVHCAGTRMIAQGTDALSRGSLLEGVMTGTPMLDYIPLNLSCIDRSPDLMVWIRSWCRNCIPLTVDQWFGRVMILLNGKRRVL